MNSRQLADELDCAIEELRLNAGRGVRPQPDSLLELAAELQFLPSAEFRKQLKADLIGQAGTQPLGSDDSWMGDNSADPFRLTSTFTQREFSMLPADPRTFLFSFISHAAVVVILASGIWVGRRTIVKTPRVFSELSHAPLPVGMTQPHGGGGGGDHSTIAASRGTPPKFSDEQLAPPAIVVHNPSPKLTVDPTVLGPPQLKLPQSNQMGDLLSSNVTIPSNGTGEHGGIGDNSGTGVGIGTGPGVGSGDGGGYGGDVFHVGSGVSAPRATYDPNPEYSDEARKAKFQGRVMLSIIVDSSGHARDIRVARSLGMGLDEKAIEAVKKWQFEPGKKDGYPVAVQVNVEVIFRLY